MILSFIKEAVRGDVKEGRAVNKSLHCISLKNIPAGSHKESFFNRQYFQMLCRLHCLISIRFSVCSQACSNSQQRTLFNFFAVSVITFPLPKSFSVTTETLCCNTISVLPEQIFRKGDPVSTTEAPCDTG